jgi:hypothetical protein
MQPLRQRLPLKELHGNEWLITVDSIVQDLHHVRTAKRCSRLRFPEEPIKGSGLASYGQVNELNCDGGTQHQLFGAPNGTKSAFAQLVF